MNNYQIIKEIGVGNYGKALLAKNMEDHNLYVIKVNNKLNQSIDISSLTQDQIDYAHCEVDVIKSLHHPYIIKYIDSFYEDGFLHIIMEYADCGDLYKLVRSQKKLNILFKEDIILNWFVQLCFAVKYIHEKNILHRDLKLSNIFLSSTGDIKLGDFGIAKVLSETGFAETMVGTPYYLSPEICQKKLYRQSSDIWSMGCILFEMMNLKHAFEANNLGLLVMKIIKGEYEPMQDRFSSDLKSLVKDMLNTNPDERPSLDNILSRGFLSKFIKLNLIKQISNSKTQENKISVNNNTETRSNSSAENSSSLNVKYLSIDSPKFSVTDEEIVTAYKVESDVTSNSKSSGRLTEGEHTKQSRKPIDVTSFSKIEKLKKILENFLGLDNFMELYYQINEYYYNKEKKINIDYNKYQITDEKVKVDIVKLIVSLIKLENSLYNQ